MSKRVWTATCVAIVTLVFVGATMAEGTTGDAVLLGRHNCSGSVTDRECSGGTRSTSIDWNLDRNPVPLNTGLAVEGDPGIIGTTNPQYVQETEIIAGVEGFGSDAGAYLYGVDWGAITNAEYVGLLATSGEVGVDARGGDVGVKATAPVALVAEGDTAIVANGAVSFNTAGLVTIDEGERTARVTLGTMRIGPGAKVLAMAQTQGGTVKRVLRSERAFTIVLGTPATQDMEVAYFVIS